MRLRVLVLDDDEGLVKGLTGMVEELGHLPASATSAEEAFAAMEGDVPLDVVLADVRLPNISGLDFLKQAKSKGYRTAVILMTAFSDIDLAVLALETGAFGFLRKPFAAKELEVMLRNVESTLRLEEHNQALRKLLEGMAVINAREPMDQALLGKLLGIAIETTKSSSGSVLLLDRAGTAVEVGAYQGLPDEVMAEFKQALAQGIAGKVLALGAPVILDERLEEGSPFKELLRRAEVVSAISAPISSEGRLLGLLNLNRTRPGSLFDEGDRGLAEVFAGATALAIENSRLREEQARNCESLQRMQRQLIQTEKLSSLGQLAAGIAHEINNPLTSVMGFAELLMRRSQEETSRDFLGKIVSNAERIKRILLDLKDFYIPSKNRQNYVDINKIIENAVPIARVHPESAGVSIFRQLTTPLPETFCDENQILQVLVNLLINSFQAMPQGGKVTIESRLDGGWLVVRVTDTGVGIPKENLSRIFDPFFTTKADWKGTGLGLSVCYTIVNNHHGTIEVDSELGKGSVFTVRLPLQGQRPQAAALREGDQPKRGRILVVDDEADCRDLLTTVLMGLGFEVDQAHNGAVAVERVRSGNRYALAFLDYKMPELNGLETFKRIREIEKDMKIIVLTGSIGESAKMIVELGAQGFINKPFRMEEVERQVRKILGAAWAPS